MSRMKRLEKPLDAHTLAAVLQGSKPIAVSLSGEFHLDALDQLILELSDGERSSPAERAKFDARLVEVVHRACRISRRHALDMRTWHFVAAVQYPEFVWRRWTGNELPEPQAIASSLSPAMVTRFAGKATLNGISRNTFARLWWAGESLSDGDDYSLAREALSRQDLFQAVFERGFGLYPPAARACVKAFAAMSEDDVRNAAVWLQQCATTTALEKLDEDQVTQLISEAP